jgi:hypothetical protein
MPQVLCGDRIGDDQKLPTLSPPISTTSRPSYGFRPSPPPTLKPEKHMHPPSKSRRAGQATTLLEIAAVCSLFRSHQGEHFATVPQSALAASAYPPNSPDFKAWMVHRFQNETGAPPTAHALRTTLHTLQAQAQFGQTGEAPRAPVSSTATTPSCSISPIPNPAASKSPSKVGNRKTPPLMRFSAAPTPAISPRPPHPTTTRSKVSALCSTFPPVHPGRAPSSGSPRQCAPKAPTPSSSCAEHPAQVNPPPRAHYARCLNLRARRCRLSPTLRTNWPKPHRASASSPATTSTASRRPWSPLWQRSPQSWAVASYIQPARHGGKHAFKEHGSYT